MKVFRLNECDWYAGEDLESVVQFAMKESGMKREELLTEDAAELTDADMERFVFLEEPEAIQPEDTVVTKTFRQHLQELIDQGQSFPCFFATTEC